MTISKSALTIASLAFIGIFGGGIYLFSQVPGIVKSQIEARASEALGVPVSIGSLSLDYQEKSAVAQNITVGNPDGFNKPQSLTVARVVAGLKDMSSEMVVIRAIEVEGTEVFVEVHGRDTNLMALKRNVDAVQAGKDIEDTPVEDAEEIAAGEEQNDEKPAPKVVIERLAVSGGLVRPSLVLVEESDLEPIALPDITLNNIGVQDNGTTARQAIAQVIEQIVEAASEEALSAGYYKGMEDAILKSLGVSNIDLLKEDAKDVGKKIKSLFE